MSPIENLGSADADRGTAPEHVQAGRYDGKVAFITGAASGIGRATARRMAAEGAKVACVDIAEAGAIEAAKEITDAGGTAVALRCDITDEASVIDAVEKTVASLGRINVVCNIAGVGGFANTHEQSLERWNQILAVNLTGTFLVCKTTLPVLLDGGGVIINTSSTAGVMGQPYSAAYCASKGGVSMMTRAIGIEYADRGVRCNAVAPAGVDTPLVHNFGLPADADFKQLDRLMTPLGYSTPSEVAGAICYMASDEAAYASGAILSIDGAISA
jgi:NAD(P)-dependent dehydrogenase (short-subunit alcohol dehydrogenase family)